VLGKEEPEESEHKCIKSREMHAQVRDPLEEEMHKHCGDYRQA
jgi:hypothetical protein